jgi:hypothetical protein
MCRQQNELVCGRTDMNGLLPLLLVFASGGIVGWVIRERIQQ